MITEDGMSYDMIAKVLNISVQEVKNIEARALKKLKIPTDKNKKLHQYFNIRLRPKEYIEDMI
jgi:DNA-directed RNA polymerase sigma subunit (sigma70/sigma32)